MFTRKTNNQNNSYKSAQFILEKSTDYLLILKSATIIQYTIKGRFMSR